MRWYHHIRFWGLLPKTTLTKPSRKSPLESDQEAPGLNFYDNWPSRRSLTIIHFWPREASSRKMRLFLLGRTLMLTIWTWATKVSIKQFIPTANTLIKWWKLVRILAKAEWETRGANSWVLTQVLSVARLCQQSQPRGIVLLLIRAAERSTRLKKQKLDSGWLNKLANTEKKKLDENSWSSRQILGLKRRDKENNSWKKSEWKNIMMRRRKIWLCISRRKPKRNSKACSIREIFSKNSKGTESFRWKEMKKK